jgi:hypothetical protein
MKKALVAIVVLVLAAVPASAAYTVVMKDGTRYQAKAKWTVVNGKALIRLENGQTLSLDPALIDAAKSEQASKTGFGSATVIAVEEATPDQTAKQPASLGSAVRVRPRPQFGEQTSTSGADQATSTSAAPPPNNLDSRLASNFERAYENVGIFEHQLAGTNRVIRAEVTADNEDKVFNAISATAFLIVRNAGLEGIQIDVVELFMRTTNGGSAGRFKIDRADAEAINNKTVALPDYYVRKVIY